jgi:imidazolonepropionase
MWDSVWYNATIATCATDGTDYGLLTDAAIAIKHGKIAWIGNTRDIPTDAFKNNCHNLQGKVITPGLIDSHTHLVYAGNRAHEFSQRLHGATYADIAKQGGGILATVAATQQASETALFQQSSKRLAAMLAHGVTTVEIKTGYGLTTDAELKQLKVITQLAQQFPGTIYPTFLAAHALPAEFKQRADDYITYVCEKTLPQAAHYAKAIDGFCENIAFTPAQIEKLFKAAQQYGLAIKLHAEQLSNQHGAALAARFQALSADHLEHLDEAGIIAMQKAGTVAILLPGAFYYLREKQLPPIELLRQYQVPMAIATDCNPGTSPTTSLPLMLNMAAVLWRLTPEETLRGVTINAAKALGLAKTHGSLEFEKNADFVVWDIAHPDELTYSMGSCVPEYIVINGQLIAKNC